METEEETGAPAPVPVFVGLGGSLRASSRTRSALAAALNLAAAAGATTHLLDPATLQLPIYHPDWALDDYPAASQAGIAELLHWSRRAQLMLWASPTYHGTISGVFKNALDFLEFASNDERPYLQGKAVGLIVVSDPGTFVAMAQAAHELRAWLAPTQVALAGSDFSPERTLNSPRGERRVQRLVAELLDFAKR